ncbi:MAG TPA: hypothetical protein GX704_05805 [Clostridiales bacterium]|jgi:hypothetical protein|nr:hypothetical protein [Clostridiales bacterium]
MKYAVKSEKITMPFPVWQMGFAARTGKSIGVNDDLYVTALLIGEERPLLLLSYDLLYGDIAFSEKMRTELSERFGIDGDSIVFFYSHTHGAVGINAADGEITLGSAVYNDAERSEVNKKCLRLVREKTIAVTEACLGSMFNGSLSCHRGQSRFGVSRRHPTPEGGVLWKPYDCDKARDTDLEVMQLRDEGGAVRAIVWSYACHPTSCGSSNLMITADYPGAVREMLKHDFPDAEIIFLQGCGADIKPRSSGRDGVFVSLDTDEMYQGSKPLYKDILTTLGSEPHHVLRENPSIKADEIRLHSEYYPRSWWEKTANDEKEPQYRRISAAAALKKMDRGELKPYMPFRMTCIRFAPDFFMITLPCEVLSAIGKRIKSLFPFPVITCAYADYSLCYIPDRKALLQGGYEAETFLDSGMTGPFVPETDDIIVGHAAAMIQNSET